MSSQICVLKVENMKKEAYLENEAAHQQADACAVFFDLKNPSRRQDRDERAKGQMRGRKMEFEGWGGGKKALSRQRSLASTKGHLRRVCRPRKPPST